MPATKTFETLEEAQNFNDKSRRKNKERIKLGARRGGGWGGEGGRKGGRNLRGREEGGEKKREGGMDTRICAGRDVEGGGLVSASVEPPSRNRLGLGSRTDSHVRRLPEPTRQQDRRPRAAVEASTQAGVGLDEGGPLAPVLARVGRNCRGGAGGQMDRRRRRLTPKSTMPS